MRIDAAMSNSFGFGGTNGTLVLRRLHGLTPVPGAMSAPHARVEPVALAPRALLALASRWPERYPVLLDSAAQGALVAILACWRRCRAPRCLDARRTAARLAARTLPRHGGFLAALEQRVARGRTAGAPRVRPRTCRSRVAGSCYLGYELAAGDRADAAPCRGPPRA